MTDITTRLRTDDVPKIGKTAKEAAKEIDRLRAVNAELLAALVESVAMIDNLNSAYGSDEIDQVAKRGREAIKNATA